MNEKNENLSMQQPINRRGGVPRLIIRAGNGTLGFLLPHEDGRMEYSPYTVRSGVSIAANLRAAFHDAPILRNHGQKVMLSVSSPVVLMPIDEYMDNECLDADLLYDMTLLGHEGEQKVSNVLPDLSAVAIFGVNKDLKMVVEDHFSDVRIQNVVQPVWSHLYRRTGVTTQRKKLYGYFHDRSVDVFSFQARRFRFANRFDANHLHDALYYLLFVWNQLSFSNEDDEMHIIGNIENREWLINKLKSYLRRVYVLSPSAELNRLPVTQIEGLDFDMML